MQGVDGPPQLLPEFLAEFSTLLQQVKSHVDYTEPADEVDLLTPTKMYDQCMACLHKHQLVVILRLHPKVLLTHAECRSKQMLNPDRVHHVALWMWTDEASIKYVENRSLCVKLDDSHVTHYSHNIQANHKMVSRSEK